MAIEIIDISALPGAFKVQGVGGAALSGDERNYARAVARIMDSLASDARKDPAEPDTLAEAERKLRQEERAHLLSFLRADAEQVIAGESAPNIAADNAFVRRGMYLARQTRRSERLFKVYEDRDANGIPTDILIAVSSEGVVGPTSPTEEQQALFVAIENARTVVSTVANRVEAEGGLLSGKGTEAQRKERASAIRKRFLRGLAEIARVGLEGGHPKLAKAALETFKSEFVANEAGRIKNGYVVALGTAAGIATLACLVLHFALVLFLDVDHPLLRYRVFFAAGAGAAVGTWLSFSIRRVTLTFDELAIIEDDLLDPQLRIVFVLLLTMIVLLLFWTGIMNIEIGQLKTGDLGKPRTALPMGSIAFLIGAFCGMSERALATAMSGRAAAFVRTLTA